jgi:hypothetical protein
MTAPALPKIATCGGCPSTFPALDVCHCASCHLSFATVELFAEHRAPDRHGRRTCKRPDAMGLVLRAGVWHLAPMSHADRLARWQAQRAQTDDES